MIWLDRSGLAAHAGGSKASAGWWLAAVPGEGFVPLSPEARASLRTRSAATLAAAGIAGGRRVLLSLNSDGDLSGSQLAEAVVEAGASAAVVGARGRMRTLAAFRALRPQIWITTPTGALDFLARLYLEFNVDPVELELDRILVVGEIASPGTERRLASEFETEVAGIYCDPIFGGVWAHGRDGKWTNGAPDVLGWSALAQDVWQGGESDGERRELVLRPDWSGPFAGTVIRTGQVSGLAPATGLFAHSVGEHLLVRGRWLSLPLLRRALAGIDGIAGFRVAVDRGEGTLDKLTITLGFARPGLVENPMWAARAREAIAGITPVEFALETVAAEADPQAESRGAGPALGREIVADARGHHLGVDRQAVARASEASHGG